LTWGGRLDVDLVEADICAGQCLHLALKLPSTFSGTSKSLKTIGWAFPAILDVIKFSESKS